MPLVNLHDGKLRIVQDMTRWPVGKFRRASVNSFGYGGANAHAILDSIEHLAPDHGGVQGKRYNHGPFEHVNGQGSHVNGLTNDTNATNLTNGANEANGHSSFFRRPFLLTFSAHNEETLKQNIASLRGRADKYDILDLAYTLGCRRSRLAIRTFVIASQDTMVDSMDIENPTISKAMGSRILKLGFVFTGRSFFSSEPWVKLIL